MAWIPIITYLSFTYPGFDCGSHGIWQETGVIFSACAESLGTFRKPMRTDPQPRFAILPACPSKTRQSKQESPPPKKRTRKRKERYIFLPKRTGILPGNCPKKPTKPETGFGAFSPPRKGYERWCPARLAGSFDGTLARADSPTRRRLDRSGHALASESKHCVLHGLARLTPPC